MTRRRVGLIADTRIPEAGRDLPDEACDALAGCDQILRCGDLHTIEVVDRVECLAPTIARRGSGDTFELRIGRPGAWARTSAFPTYSSSTWRGFRIGLTHDVAAGQRDGDVITQLATNRPQPA